MAGNLFDQINIRGTVDAWARFTIVAWRKELRKKNVGVTDELYRSFTYQLQRNSSELTGVLLKFKYYGRFTDMGVGKGLSAHERSNNRINAAAARRYGANVDSVGRRPNKWLNKVKTAQSHRLREILAEKASAAVAQNIGQSLTSEFNISING